MNEMKYSKERITRCLYEEKTEDGYMIIIISLGTHPCAYIGVPKGHKLYGVSSEELNDSECYIDCHYGCNYSDDNVMGFHRDYWFLGWDYGHCDDFIGYYLKDGTSELLRQDKKWTTEEIYQECLVALEDIKKIDIIEENVKVKKFIKNE